MRNLHLGFSQIKNSSKQKTSLIAKPRLHVVETKIFSERHHSEYTLHRLRRLAVLAVAVLVPGIGG